MPRQPALVRPVALLLTTVVALAGLTALAGPSTANGTVGRITGVVTGPDGEPLEGIAVYAKAWSASTGVWQNARVDVTDASGAYDLTGLSPRNYRLLFFDESKVMAREYWNDAATIEAATDVPVVAGQVTSDRNAMLGEGGHITGTVTGPDELPLESAHVIAYIQRSGRWHFTASTDTDANGNYDITGLSTDTYRLRFSQTNSTADSDYVGEYWDDAATVESAADVPVTVGMTSSGHDAQLGEGGHITGTVTLPNGQPAANFPVFAYQWNATEQEWRQARYDATDANGHYDLDQLFTNNYRLVFQHNPVEGFATTYWSNATSIVAATDVPVVVGQTTSGRDVQLSELNHITGTVTGPGGTPLAGIDVHAFVWDTNTQHWTWDGSGDTDSTGGYNVGVRHAGRYRLFFRDFDGNYLSAFWGDAATVDDAVDIEVGPGATVTGKNGQLTAPTLSGEVRVGKTVRVAAAFWAASGVDLEYQWLVAGYPVDGATNATYTPRPADVGKSLHARVMTTDGYLGVYGYYASSAHTSAVAVGPGALKQVTKPKLTGTAKKGATLSVSKGTWSPTAVTVKYQWFANGKAIAKATGATLKLTRNTLKAVAGKTIAVKVTVSATGYTPVTTTLTAPGKAKA